MPYSKLKMPIKILFTILIFTFLSIADSVYIKRNSLLNQFTSSPSPATIPHDNQRKIQQKLELETLQLKALEQAKIAEERRKIELARQNNFRKEETKLGLKKWDNFVEITPQFLGDKKTVLSDLFFITNEWQDSLLFIDLRTKIDSEQNNEYNLGLGYRQIFYDKIYGSYIFYDRKKTAANNFFNQITIGAERLSEDWDLRFNLYFPENKEEKIAAAVAIENNKLQVSYGGEKALRGADFEVGRRLPFYNSRLFIGGYYFASDNDNGFVYKKISGIKSRLESKICDFLTIGAQLDGHNSELTIGAFARIRFDFGNSVARKLSAMEARMNDRIIRDIDIITSKYWNITSDVVLAINGATPTQVDFIDLSSTSSALTNNISDAGKNSLVILSGSGTTNGTISLNSGQVLLGGNSNLTINYSTPRGTKSVIYSPNLSAAYITNSTSTANVIKISKDNVAIKGVNISGGLNGIYISGDNLDINLQNINIENSADDGISGSSSDYNNINMSDIILDNIADNGIYFSSTDNSVINMSNFKLSNIGDNGAYISSSSENNVITINNFVVSDISGSIFYNADSSNSINSN